MYDKFFKRKIPTVFSKKYFSLLKNWFFWFKLFYTDDVGGYFLHWEKNLSNKTFFVVLTKYFAVATKHFV